MVASATVTETATGARNSAPSARGAPVAAFRIEITGGVVSTTMDTDADADFPDRSVAMAVSVAGPSGRAIGPDWNAPSLPTEAARPSTVTPPRFASAANPVRKIGPGPRMAPGAGEEIVTAGACVSTVQVEVAIALFPAASRATAVSPIVPSENGNAAITNCPLDTEATITFTDTATASPQVP